ncbi:hypothetical protein L228DRAFT_257875 [Xylona heveae TC161]|uniref:Zn(2)-C6 fungal-type domain-containing protein n=1 Tax=Xylona heveae (strain CBS 132557 / TC161) TaxID=1328760 RepID=A0A165JMY8_XYLHT|nr:hypothetical protein L228DRAFT_257875 [Xylona heveae TC161]KZF26436.1 hypothetical protein L228DRAFT_257875 [Xylona heveae TC161]
MGSRRFHSKSRHGCSQCKRRRVKCDEQLPCCRSCSKRGIECSLMNAFADTPRRSSPVRTQQDNGSSKGSPSEGVSRETSPTTPSPSNTPIVFLTTPAPALSPFPDRPLRELELMHHYMAFTWKCLPGRDISGKVMGEVVPREALKHDFLMHSMLSISAIHLAHLRSSNKHTYLATAVQQADLALRLTRAAIQNITPANHAIIFMGTCFVNAFAFSFPQTRHLDHFCDLLLLFRGCIAVLMLGRQRVRSSSLGELLSDPTGGARRDLPRHASQALETLQLYGDALAVAESTKRVYRRAIDELRESFLNHYSFPDHHYNIFGWPHCLPEELIVLLKARVPFALAILAHYCVILHNVDHLWWAQRWGQDVFISISSVLSPEWQFLIDWPRRMIFAKEL